MAGTLTASRFSIELPGDPAYLSTVRLFASAIARHHGVDEDTVEDVKTAVSEACSAFLHYQESPGGTLHVAVTAEEGRLSFEVTSPDLSIRAARTTTGDATPTPRGLAAEIGVDLIRTLFEGSEVSPDGAPAIRFQVPRPV